MQPTESSEGLIHALVLDGLGGARRVDAAGLTDLELAKGESLWVHMDRTSPMAQDWLREKGGLSLFAWGLLLEENTRPRSLSLPGEQLLLFLRGVNLNPGAEPEDMVSLRVFADSQRLFSLRLRPLGAAEGIVRRLNEGRGPRNTSELLLQLAVALTDRVEELIPSFSDWLDDEEEAQEADANYVPDHQRLAGMRRRAAGLRRFLSPQREIFSQMSRNLLGWVSDAERGEWNELSNQLIRHLEELELVRERVTLLIELQQRRLGERMNRIMYLLAVITGFFLPLSFLTGLLGINVGGIPGSENPQGFFAACAIIGLVATLQWLMLRRLRWL